MMPWKIMTIGTRDWHASHDQRDLALCLHAKLGQVESEAQLLSNMALALAAP